MEIVKIASKWGNSAGVVLPKNWVGKQVKIILIDRTKKIKEEVLDILKDDLQDLIGIYLVGSYARGEENGNSDVDIIAISNNLKKEISSEKFNISIYPFQTFKKTSSKFLEGSHWKLCFNLFYRRKKENRNFWKIQTS